MAQKIQDIWAIIEGKIVTKIFKKAHSGHTAHGRK